MLKSYLIVFFISMLPLVELRGAIPVGIGMGLPILPTYLVCVVGNMLPVPFIILFIRQIFAWMRRHMPKLDGFVAKIESKAHLKGETVQKYGPLGLLIFVAIPLPGTGAWTGALVAAMMEMRLKRAFPAIVIGVVIAGVIVSIVTYGAQAIFSF